MTATNSVTPSGNNKPPAATPPQEVIHPAVMFGWMAVLMALLQNTLATNDLQTSESGLLTNIAQMTQARTQAMYGDPNNLKEGTLTWCTWYMSAVLSGQYGGPSYAALAQQDYSNVQIQGQADTAAMNREADQWSNTLQSNTSSTDSNYQNAQALMSIAQMEAQRA